MFWLRQPKFFFFFFFFFFLIRVSIKYIPRKCLFHAKNISLKSLPRIQQLTVSNIILQLFSSSIMILITTNLNRSIQLDKHCLARNLKKEKHKAIQVIFKQFNHSLYLLHKLYNFVFEYALYFHFALKKHK